MPKKDKLKVNMHEKVEDNVCDLSLSNLAVVPVKEIAAFKRVTILDLSSNRLTSLGSNFCCLTRLVKLDLSNNQIRILPDKFGSLASLRHLNLFNNRIEYLPLSFGDLSNLRYLDMKGNPLTAALLDVVGPCLTTRDCEESARCTVHFISYMRSQHQHSPNTLLTDQGGDPSTAIGGALPDTAGSDWASYESEALDMNGGSSESSAAQCHCNHTCRPELQDSEQQDATVAITCRPACDCHSRSSSQNAFAEEAGFTVVASRRNSTADSEASRPPPPTQPAPLGPPQPRPIEPKSHTNPSQAPAKSKKRKCKTSAAASLTRERYRSEDTTAIDEARAAGPDMFISAYNWKPIKLQWKPMSRQNGAAHKQATQMPQQQTNNNNTHSKSSSKKAKAAAQRHALMAARAADQHNPVLASISMFFLLLLINVVIIYVMMFKNPEFAEKFVEFIPAGYRAWLYAKTELFRLHVSDWISEFRTAPEEN